MINNLYFSSDGKQHQNLSIDELKLALQDSQGLLWVNLEAPTPEEFQLYLSDVFNFHTLAIEDCQSLGYQPPKVDDFGDYLFIIAHAIKPDQSFDELETMELNIFLGQNYVVTSHLERDLHPITHTFEAMKKDRRIISNGSDFLCHAILDVLVDDYMPLLDKMDEEIEWLEDTVLSKPDPSTLERILNLKHSLMALRRIISPQREIMNRLSRDDYPQIDRQSKIYFRDIYDHLVRIQDLTETIRDIVSGALDIYLNSTSLRLNNIMKALTIVSTIFLPLSFVAGVYGMNFQYMPEIYWQYGYLFVWIIFVVIFIGLLVTFKRRGWF